MNTRTSTHTGPTGKDPNVVIVGGGVGGLAAAAFLDRAGIETRVVERGAQLSEVGAGIFVAPNAARLLARLGLRDQLVEKGVALAAGWEFRRWQDGRVLSSQPLTTECRARYGEDTWTLHRTDLIDMLRSAVPSEGLVLGANAAEARIVGDDAGVVLEDGRILWGDAIIGADGIHSRMRHHLAGRQPARFSGLCAWRCLIPAEKAPELARRPAQTLWLGPERHVVHYPVAGGALINVGAITASKEPGLESWESTGTVENLLAEFSGWDDRLLTLLSAAESVGRWPLLDRAPLDTWVAGRLALLGDAAHPMFPLFAQGAAQAMEDAAALGALLAGRTAKDLPAALASYDRVRRPRAHRVQEMSRGRRSHHHLPDGPEQRARDAEFAAADPLAAVEWLYNHDATLVEAS